jgi:hypothetical protein
MEVQAVKQTHHQLEGAKLQGNGQLYQGKSLEMILAQLTIHLCFRMVLPVLCVQI